MNRLQFLEGLAAGEPFVLTPEGLKSKSIALDRGWIEDYAPGTMIEVASIVMTKPLDFNKVWREEGMPVDKRPTQWGDKKLRFEVLGPMSPATIQEIFAEVPRIWKGERHA